MNGHLFEKYNPADPANPGSPFKLQITSLLVARGAGGRGEALRSAPTPQGVKGVPVARALALAPAGPQVLKAQGVRLCRRPLPFLPLNLIKNRIRKKFRILTPNGLPKGPSKSQKSDKVSRIGISNTFRELLGPLLL